MDPALIIKSTRDEGILELRPYDSDYFTAIVSARRLRAEARVGRYMSEGLGEFFRYLATNWKGWKGERTWSSLESEFALRAKSDLTGHAYLDVHLHEGAPPLWSVDLLIELEAGQLERIAEEAEEFEKLAIVGPDNAFETEV